jgi:hypothetical protein
LGGGNSEVLSSEDKILSSLIFQNKSIESNFDDKRRSQEVKDVYNGVMDSLSQSLKRHS